jgi:hypothetical protein
VGDDDGQVEQKHVDTTLVRRELTFRAFEKAFEDHMGRGKVIVDRGLRNHGADIVTSCFTLCKVDMMSLLEKPNGPSYLPHQGS